MPRGQFKARSSALKAQLPEASSAKSARLSTILESVLKTTNPVATAPGSDLFSYRCHLRNLRTTYRQDKTVRAAPSMRTGRPRSQA